MSKQKIHLTARDRRHRRIRIHMQGTTARPRLVVFRSHRAIEAQIIDDGRQMTLVHAHDREVTPVLLANAENQHQEGKIGRSWVVGRVLAEKARSKKILNVVFDRGGYRYHGRVRALAEGARSGGLLF